MKNLIDRQGRLTMKKLILTIAALALGAARLAQDTVRIGTEGAYPPWNFINDANELDGFERELGDEMCARAELTCEWVINDWDTIIPNLVAATTTPSWPACRSPRRAPRSSPSPSTTASPIPPPT
jgi:hypothetical protein